MIGDLLCLPAIDADQIAAFTRHGEFDDADEYDRQSSRRLAAAARREAVAGRAFRALRLPSRGTLLAGENIDIFLSVLTNLVGLIPGVGRLPLYEVPSGCAGDGAPAESRRCARESKR